MSASHRSRGLLATAIVGAALLTTTAGWALWAAGMPASETPSPPPVSTVPVTSGDMVAQTDVVGTLQYATSIPVVSTSSGTVTELPAVGAVAGPGAVLYRVDTRPVVLLRGSVPAWRDFASGMSDGDDVKQLESNLRAWGFFDFEPDTRFTWDTVVAVRAWQRSLGVEQTGIVGRSSIVFADQDLRVNTVNSRVGALVGDGAALYDATGLEQVVSIGLKTEDRALAVPDAAVSVILPTGATLAGTVSSVEVPTQKPNADGNGSRIVVPATVRLASQDGIDGLALSTVTVRFARAMREGVLTVPVDALVPLDDTRYAVELPTRTPDGERRLLPVTVGAFSSGDVEISGEGIAAGLDVVVPRR